MEHFCLEPLRNVARYMLSLFHRAGSVKSPLFRNVCLLFRYVICALWDACALSDSNIGTSSLVFHIHVFAGMSESITSSMSSYITVVFVRDFRISSMLLEAIISAL